MSRFLRASEFGVALLASVVLGACSDNTMSPPAAPPISSRQDLIPSDSVALTQVSLSSTTLTIGAPPALLTTTVTTGIGSFHQMRLRASILQQQRTHPAFEVAIPCGDAQATCTFTTSLTLPSDVILGPAQLQVELIDSAFDTLLGRVIVDITLTGAQFITALSPSSTTLTIGGASSGFIATIQNTDVDQTGAAVQGWIIQAGAGLARRAAVSNALQCGVGSGGGVLPSGTCSISGFFLASNTLMGSGTLLPGPALFELDLVVNGNVRARKSVRITLVSSASVVGLTLNSTRSDTVSIEGQSVAYTATLKNVGVSMSGLALQGTVVQGSAHRFAGGGALSCTSTPGVLPNGNCTFAGQLVATSNTAGDGTLVTGAATFQVELVDAGGHVLSTANIPLTLVEGPLTSPPPGPGSDAERLPRSRGARLARP